MIDSPFFKQAKLMLQCLPSVASEKHFALKGGTAINMFVRSMPRLSVDIDLTYLPLEDRVSSLQNMSSSLERIAKSIENALKNSKVQRTEREDQIIKLVVRTPEAYIKIEPNFILRGTTSPPTIMTLVKEAEDLFEMSTSILVVPISDLYGGKIVAALDRQHPRDLFDIKLLLENEGITDEIRRGFLVFLVSHDRPMHEVVSPNRKDLANHYDREFKYMVSNPTSLEALYEARESLINCIGSKLTPEEKKFLLTMKSGDPNWSLLGVPKAKDLPGVQWKLKNIKKMDETKRKLQYSKLEKALNL
jgi:predicted nucleotidyltransferase component of viral defense system